jgi:predicted PurR-regulated permease PerM
MQDSDTRPPGVRPRDVWTVVWVVLLVAAGLFVLYEIRRILVWLLVAGFLAAVLSPAVSILERRGLRRGVAVAAVTIGLVLIVGALLYVFVRPLAAQSIEFAQDLPETVDRIQRAPLVRQALERFNIEQRVDQASPELPQRLLGLSGPLVSAFASVAAFLVALISVVVLAVFLLIYGPQFVDAGLALVGERAKRERLRRLGGRSLQAVSGWVAGNVVTSIVAGIVTTVVLLIAGVPYGVLLGLWVAFADLIPLVGATLGAIPAVIIAFTVSIPVGIAIIIFFVLYQQFENHVLQPAVYGKTIKLNPFLVLLAVLVGVELAGFLGALLALPVAGIIQIVVLDVLDERRGDIESPTPDATDGRSQGGGELVGEPTAAGDDPDPP